MSAIFDNRTIVTNLIDERVFDAANLSPDLNAANDASFFLIQRLNVLGANIESTESCKIHQIELTCSIRNPPDAGGNGLFMELNRSDSTALYRTTPFVPRPTSPRNNFFVRYGNLAVQREAIFKSDNNYGYDIFADFPPLPCRDDIILHIFFSEPTTIIDINSLHITASFSKNRSATILQ